MFPSHPSRVRGLKFGYIGGTVKSATQSHPSRVRGLKYIIVQRLLRFVIVAPFTGAWIEMLQKTRYGLVQGVAPFTGAWIEI